MQMSLVAIRRGLSIGACLLILTPCDFVQGDNKVYLKDTRFPEITRWTAVKWAAQAALAPETLRHVVPMYAYQVETLDSVKLDLDALLSEGTYIAILPPRDGVQTKPAACGAAFPVTVQANRELFKSSIKKEVEFKELIKSVANNKEITRLNKYQNCLVANQNNMDEDDWYDMWYIATSLDPTKIVREGETITDFAQIWTKTGAWRIPDSTDANAQSALSGTR